MRRTYKIGLRGQKQVSLLQPPPLFPDFHSSMFFSHAGYSRSIPGNPRYKVLGTNEDGEFSLQINDVSLEDDADYECQVGPANFNRPIRHRAHLHVLRK